MIALRCTGAGLLTLALLFPVSTAQAQDAVDSAFAAGNEAASKRRYRSAVQHYERARKLTPGSSAQLSYNLGTAYAQLGQLGFATVHLHHALDQSQDSALADRARQNLGLLRRQAETQAAASGRVLSEPPHWSGVVIAFLGTQAVGWGSLVLWWIGAAAALWVMAQRRRAQTLSWALPIGITIAALFLSALYLFARNDRQEGEFIVVGDTLALRDGPGEHRALLFEIQPSSQVRLLQESSGWAQVRLPGARQGWIVKRALAPLQPWSGSIPVGLKLPAKSKNSDK